MRPGSCIRPGLFVLLMMLCTTGERGFTQAGGSLGPALLDGLRFRTVGPALYAGRIDDMAVYEANTAIFYAASTTGGLWKTVNNGTTWEVLFNTEDDVISIG